VKIKYRLQQIWLIGAINFFLLSLCFFSTELLAENHILETEKQATARVIDDALWQVIPPLKAEITTLQKKGFNSAEQLFANINKTSEIYSVAYSPDSKTLLSGSSDDILKLWEISSGRLLRTFSEYNDDSISSVAFSPDGKTVLSGSNDALKLWAVNSGQLLRTFSGHDDIISSVAFSPDGKVLLSGSIDRTLKLWAVDSGQLLYTFMGHHDWVMSVAFSPDGKTVLSGSNDNTLKLWAVDSGQLLRTFSGHDDRVNSVTFSPDGKMLLSSSWDKTLKLWAVDSGQLLRTFSGYDEEVSSVAFSPDGKTVLSGSNDALKLWAVNSGQLLRTFSKDDDNLINPVAFSPDGKTLLGSSNNSLKLWAVGSGQLLRTFSGHHDWVDLVAFNPDGKILLSSNGDTIKLWAVDSGQLLHTFWDKDWMYSATFSPDGKTLLSGSSDNTLKLWAVDSGQLLRTFSGHDDRVISVAFSPSGKTLLSGSWDKTLKLWAVDSGKLLRTFSGHDDSINSVAFSPDGKILLSGSDDNTLKLWEVSSGKLLRTFSGHDAKVNSVAFSPDGKMLLSGSRDRYRNDTLKLWEVDSGKPLRDFIDHNGSIHSVAFSPDGKMLISNAWDTLKLWAVDSGQLLHTFSGHDGKVNSVAFSPDGKMLLSGSSDQTIKQWDIKTGQLKKTLWAGNNSTWLSINYHPNNEALPILNIANNGSIFPQNIQENILSNEKQLSNKDNLKLEFEPLEIIAEPNKTQLYPIKVRNTGKLPTYWLSLEQNHLALNTLSATDKPSAYLYITPAEPPLIQPNQPSQSKTIQVLEAGQSATLYANIFASIPYQSSFVNLNPEGYYLPISAVTANGTKVTKNLSVKIKLPKLDFIQSENSYNSQEHQLQLTLQNMGEDSLNNASFSLKWPKATASQIKASEVIRPEIKPQDKVPLSFAIPADLSKQQIANITLTVATKDYPWYLWQTKPEINVLTRFALLIGLAMSLLLLGLSLFFYRRYRIFKHPLVLRLSHQPNELLTLAPEQLAEAKRRLQKAQLLKLVLDKVNISANTLEQAISTFHSQSAQQKAQYLAHQLGAQLITEPTQHKACYELKLNHDFILNLERLRLYFPQTNTDPKDVFTAIKALTDSNRYITLIMGKNSQYQRNLYAQTQKTSNKWVAPQSGELSSLFLSPNADQVLMRILAGQLSLQYISPYQIGGGVKKQGIFFGRKEMIHQIVTNDPANYLVVGGRQMGKSSLLRALQRHYRDLASIDCCYITLSDEALIPRVVKKLGLKKTHQPEVFAHQLELYLQNCEQHMVFLLDESDQFVDYEISTNYPVLNVMRRLSEEGHCTFILAGFWQLYQHAVLDYQSPIRNFAETIYVGALEKEACYQLATVPMQNINLSYANKKIVKTLIKACGQRANLIAKACKFIVVNMSTGQRVINAEDVQNALYSDEINKELASWVLSNHKIKQYYDKLIVYTTIHMNDFSSGELIQRLQEKGISVDINALDRSLARLGLVCILGKDQQSGRYAYHVPLFVEMIQRDDPEIRLHAVLSTGY